MLHLKKWVYRSLYSIVALVFALSLNVFYSSNAYAEKWEACTMEYTVMDMLSELIFVQDKPHQMTRESEEKASNRQSNTKEVSAQKTGNNNVVIRNNKKNEPVATGQ